MKVIPVDCLQKGDHFKFADLPELGEGEFHYSNNTGSTVSFTHDGKFVRQQISNSTRVIYIPNPTKQFNQKISKEKSNVVKRERRTKGETTHIEWPQGKFTLKELAAQLKLSYPTVFLAAKDALVRKVLVKEGKVKSSGRGKPATIYSLKL